MRFARQVQRVAAEGVAHREIHRHPVAAAMRLQRRGDVFTGDETDGMHVAEVGQHDALQIALLAAAGGQQSSRHREIRRTGFSRRESGPEDRPNT